MTQYPKPGVPQEHVLKFQDATIHMEWTTPKYRAWRRLETQKSTMLGFAITFPAKVGELREALYETAVIAGNVRISGVPDGVIDGKPDSRGWYDAQAIVEGCASADLLVTLGEQVLAAASLSDVQKKASASPPASSSTEEAPLPGGITIPTPRSVEPEAVEREA